MAQAPTIFLTKLVGDVLITAAADGDMLVFNGTKWVDVASTGTGSPVRGSAPTIDGGVIQGGTIIDDGTIQNSSITGSQSLGVRSLGSGAFDLLFQNTETLSSARTITITTGDASRTLTLSGNPSLSGVTISNGGTIDTGGFTLTVPATGTAALLGVANVFSAPQTIGTTNTLRFGATAAATVGVSADTTAGILQLISPTSGTITLTTANALSATLSGGAAFSLTGGAGNMTITSGTGNSRTMILRTTTSGGTATTALTLNADQTATFAGAVTCASGGFTSSSGSSLGNDVVANNRLVILNKMILTGLSDGVIEMTNYGATRAELRLLNLVASGTLAVTGEATVDSAVTAARVGGVIKDFFADVGNGTTVETDIFTFTTVANTLLSNGDKVEAQYAGLFVSSGTATRQIRIYFGGVSIFDSGALTLSLSSAWDIYVLVIRTSSSTVRAAVSMTTQGAALAAYTAETDVTGLTLSSTNILKLTAQAAGVGAATNDVVGKLGSLKWYPAGA